MINRLKGEKPHDFEWRLARSEDEHEIICLSVDGETILQIEEDTITIWKPSIPRGLKLEVKA